MTFRNLHAHVSTAAADCDGPIHRDYVETFNDAEREESGQVYNDFSEIHFMDRVFISVCGPYAVRQMRVTVDEDGIEFHESTDEGYRQGQVRWCRDACDTDETHYRDIRAEEAGY